MTIIIQPTAQKTRFSQKIMSKQNKMIPLGRFLLDITHDQAMLAKSKKLENMSENIHEICGNKKIMDIGAKQRQKSQ
jgi:hypothetical protein